jgi:prevent-host-death family protein
MKKVTVTVLKNKLSYYLRQVKHGESIEILERSVPIARLEPISGKRDAGDGLLRRLIRDGIVTPGRESRAEEFLKKPPVKSKLDPVKILIEERGDR